MNRSCLEGISTRTGGLKLKGGAFPSSYTNIKFHKTSLSSLKFNVSNLKGCSFVSRSGLEGISTRTRGLKLTGGAFPSTYTNIKFHKTLLSLLKFNVSNLKGSSFVSRSGVEGICARTRGLKLTGGAFPSTYTNLKFHKTSLSWLKFNDSDLKGCSFESRSGLEGISTRTRGSKLTGGAFLSTYTNIKFHKTSLSLLKFNVSKLSRSGLEGISTRTRGFKLTGGAFPSTYTNIKFHKTSLSLLKFNVSNLKGYSFVSRYCLEGISTRRKGLKLTGGAFQYKTLLSLLKFNVSNLKSCLFVSRSGLEGISTRRRGLKLMGAAFPSTHTN